MKRITLFAIAVCLCLSGCDKAPLSSEQLAKEHEIAARARQLAADQATIKNATQLIVDTMRDPESVRFRKLRLVRVKGDKGSTAKTVCGELNAKNAYGGYVGYQPFFYLTYIHAVATDKENPNLSVGTFRIIEDVDPNADPFASQDKMYAQADFDDLCNHDHQTIRDTDLRWAGNAETAGRNVAAMACSLGVHTKQTCRK